MRHPLFHLLLPLILVCCLCGSCRRDTSVSPHLLQAEALMDSAPDSALNILNATDTNLLVTPADRALHTLLLTQARYKTDIPSTDTAPIQAAADYFRSSSDHHHLMLSLYYLGEILRQASKYDEALKNLLEADKLATELENRFYLGLIDRGISATYCDVYLSDMCLSYSQQAVSAFEKSGNKEYWNYERINLATSYMMTGECDRALNIIDSVVDMAQTMSDSITISDAIASRGYIRLHKRDWARGIADLQAAEHSRTQQEAARDKQAMIYAYTQLGKLLEADSVYKLLPSEQSDIFITLHQYHASHKDYEAAYKTIQRQCLKQDSLVRTLTRQKVASASESFNRLQLDKERLIAKNQRLRLSLILLATIFVACLTVGYLIFKKRMSDRKITSLLRDYDFLSNEFGKLANKSDIRTPGGFSAQNWKALFKKQFSMLDQLCAEYYETPNTSKTAKLAKKIEYTILQLKNDTQFVKGIFDDINLYNDNLIRDLQESIDTLTQAEYTLLALLCSGLSNQAISIILSIDLAPLYVRKSRLKTKITKLEFPRKEELLALMAHDNA